MTRIPNEVARPLAACVRRVRLLRLCRGLLATATAFLLLALVAMAADAKLTIFDDRIRWTLTGGLYVATLVVLWWTVVRAWRRRLDLRKMAQALDARHPEHEECLSTLVEVVEETVAKNREVFSPTLVAALADRATKAAAKIDAVREFPKTSLSGRAKTLGALAGLLAVGLLLVPRLTGLLFLRVTMPWIEVGNLYANQLQVTPGDVVALDGTVIRITAEADRSLMGEPMIRISRKTRFGWGREFAEPLAKGAYETTASAADGPWRYRISCGPAVSRYFSVRVSTMPKYESFAARVAYPEYTGRKASVVSNDAVKTITAIEGSRVDFELRISEPGTRGTLVIGGAEARSWQMVSNAAAPWSLDLVNADGFAAPPRRGLLASRRDQAPAVVIENEKKDLMLSPHEKLPIAYTAMDDVGVGGLQTVYSVDGRPYEPSHDEAWSGTERLKRGTAEIDLSYIDLVGANAIRVALVVRDRYPSERGGPHAVTSTPVTVKFDVAALSYEMQTLADQMKTTFREMDEAESRLAAALTDAQNARNRLANDHGRISEETEKVVEKLAHEVAEAEKRAEEIVDYLSDTDGFRAQAEELRNFIEDELAPVREKLETAQFAAAEERQEALEAIQPMLTEAKQRLDRAEADIKARAEDVKAFEKAKDVLARQEALAKAAERIVKERPVDTDKLEAWKRMEQSAAKEAAEISSKLPDPGLEEAKRKMDQAVALMENLKREMSIENNTNLSAKAKTAKRAELAAQVAKDQENAFNKAVENTRNAEKTLAAALEKARQFAAAQDTPTRSVRTHEMKQLLRQAADSQRAAEDALGKAEVSEELKKLAQEASALRREAAKTTSDPVTGLTAALEAERKSLASLDPKYKMPEEKEVKGKGEGEGEERKAALKLSQERALAELKRAEEAGQKALDALRARETTPVQEAQKAMSEALAAARKENLAHDLLAQAEHKMAEAQREGNAVVANKNENNYNLAALRQKEALNQVKKASDALAKELGADPEALASQRRAEALADRVKAAEIAAKVAGKKAANLEAKKNVQAAANERKMEKRLADRAEGLREQAEKAAERAKILAAEAAAKDEGKGDVKDSDATAQKNEGGKVANDGKADGRGEENPAADKRAQEAADEARKSVKARAEELGMTPPDEEKSDEDAQKDGDDGDKNDDRNGKSGKGKSKRRDSENPEKNDANSSSGVMADLEKAAKELVRHDAEEEAEKDKSMAPKGWQSIRGAAHGGLGELDLRSVPAEYRELVKAYFLYLVETEEK